MDRAGVKNYKKMLFFDRMCITCDKIYIICSKVEFATNINNITGIRIFYFYNNKHTLPLLT